MQIHDITRRKQVQEGLLDGIKSTIQTARTGASGNKGTLGKIAGAAKALTDPYAYSAAKSDVYAQQIEKNRSKFDARLAQAERQQAERQYQYMVQKFGDGVLVFPGEKLQLSTRGGTYFKTSDAKWVDEAGNPVDTQTANGLEKIADSGKGEVIPDTSGATAQTTTQKTSNRQAKQQARQQKRDQEERIRQYNLQQQNKLPVMSTPVKEATTPQGDQAFKNEMYKIQKLDIAQVKQSDPELGGQLEQALDALAKSRGKPQQFKTALKTYVDLSVQAQSKMSQSYGGYGGGYSGSAETAATQSQEDNKDAQTLATIMDQIGMDRYQLGSLGRKLGVRNQSLRSTDNSLLNLLLQQMGARLS